ncbi:MAG: 2-oxoacid:ferredoxin oxidoreductase subunit beta [Candidatus Terrybacteria bacterium]|nr:2-oxoacid:ferredoxin oxidoreductase subunit beta [Candidatus Terrybacteria bacterium]
MTQVRSPKEYDAREHFWCPGCGDAGDLAAIKRFCVKHDIDPSMLVDSAGIGCSSKIAEYHKCNGHHWLHGRSLPVALAVKTVNPKLFVIDAGGDGDGGAIGMEHFIHSCRRNPSVVYILMNNQVYGLTKGQASLTAHKGLVTPTTPDGAKDEPVDMVELAIAAGATFVARGYSYRQDELGELLDAAYEHILALRGFAYVETLSPCPTFHREPAHDQLKSWYEENILDVITANREMHEMLVAARDIDPAYDPYDRARVLTLIARVKETSGKLLTGILYRNDGKAALEEKLGVRDHAIVDLDLSPEANRETLERLIDSFR